MINEDYSHLIKLEYGSTKYDWSLLANAKYVVECTFKEGYFRLTKYFACMYDADIIEQHNGVISPENIRVKLLLDGKFGKNKVILAKDLIKAVFHFRHEKPFNTESFVKHILADLEEKV